MTTTTFPAIAPILERHPECGGTYDPHNGDYDCEYGTTITCDECKYGGGRKDPWAARNQPKQGA